MTFISYAQNFEDVMLWRALRHIEKGFYVDVGAMDPIIDSTTQAFYERGWRGVNIEPARSYYEKLSRSRPLDINLPLAVSDAEGMMKFYEVPETGLSTLDLDTARMHHESGLTVIEKQVSVVTLNQILAERVKGPIHFMKIDVEGAEKNVLQGLDLSRWRPWIMVMESTKPNSSEVNYEAWEDLILTAGYDMVYFDGLNRFYVAHEHSVLAEKLRLPPNFFDNFIVDDVYFMMADRDAIRADRDAIRADRDAIRADRDAIRADRDAIRADRDRIQIERNRIQIERDRIQTELDDIYYTLSWRITRPLRQLKDGIRQIQYIFENRIKFGLIKPVLRETLQFILVRPQLKKSISSLLVYLPWLKARLEGFAGNVKETILLPAAQNQVEDRDYSSVDHLLLHYDAQFMPTPPVIFPSRTGCRKIYYFVDHTVLCPFSTGMQRVTRLLGKALLEAGEHLLFVKWDVNNCRFVLINQDELAHLSQWSGPVLSAQVLEQYPKSGEDAIPIEKHKLDAGHWLVVPEVTHITYQPHPVTLDVLVEAKRQGLKTAFIYYDATPLRRADLKSMASNHETYMQQLLLVDLIVPISNWSARDLVSFFRVHERADLTPTPRIVALPLPGESQMTRRVTVPARSDETQRFILSVGSIVPHKNQMTLLHAFERFCKLYPETDWRLVLVGNLHPDFAEEMKKATHEHSRITYLSHVSDEQLDTLYRSCSFTVFPSVEEGFGLPILESLWYAKPCICANFGAMREAAEGGGCLAVDTRDGNELLQAIVRLAEEPSLLDKLSEQAVMRSISTWNEYGQRFIALLDEVSNPLKQMGVIYYWVDHTATYPANSGIQRVLRGLARALIELGLKLIPVKWDEVNKQFYSPSEDELDHLAGWNGPEPSEWSAWVDPSQLTASDWILIPELTSYLQHTSLTDIKRYASACKLRIASIFYDAIPFKMQEIYPREASYAHEQYMRGLNEFDLILPISQFSRVDLLSFLSGTLLRTHSLEDRIQASVLPGEFLESVRITDIKQEASALVKILCVGTIEPRKNHLSLLQAFSQVVQQSKRQVELTIVGGTPFPELAAQVQDYVDTVPGIRWEKDINDTRLRELYAECDFTVYPSLEEGFGLPILESLWYARPCICRDSGAMAEAAEGGGCLAVETANPDVLADALLRLAEDDAFRIELAHQAVNRPFKTWLDYAREVAMRMAKERYIPLQQPLPESISAAEFYGQFVNLTPRPLLSICISTYNRAEWLSVSLKNLARLLPIPRAELEIVVCDNTSSDHTPQMVQPYLHRSDFHYYRNPENVGMLGNLRITAHHARGRYIWILGDDDLVKPGSIEKVLRTIQKHPDVSLIYLNYGYTHQDNAKAIVNLDKFLSESTPIVDPGKDVLATVSEICTRSENFFTAIYCLVFRRDHALRAYTQNTEGRPFSTLLTCIPTTYYTLNFMMNETAYWVGDPQVVINLNVSWMKYAPLWILERIPEVYDLAERLGADPQLIDRWRKYTLPGVIHWFRNIYEHDEEGNIRFFSSSRLVARIKHLDTYPGKVQELRAIYESAHAAGHPGAKIPPSRVFFSKVTEN